MSAPIGLNSSIHDLFAAAQTGATPERTGRFIITWKDHEAGQRMLRERVGLTVANAADFRGPALDFRQLPATGALVFPNLNMALLHAEPERISAMTISEPPRRL